MIFVVAMFLYFLVSLRLNLPPATATRPLGCVFVHEIYDQVYFQSIQTRTRCHNIISAEPFDKRQHPCPPDFLPQFLTRRRLLTTEGMRIVPFRNTTRWGHRIFIFVFMFISIFIFISIFVFIFIFYLRLGGKRLFSDDWSMTDYLDVFDKDLMSVSGQD